MGLKGCCCCDLRGGSLAIGIFFLVMTLLGLLATIPGWVVFGSYQSAVSQVESEASMLFASFHQATPLERILDIGRETLLGIMLLTTGLLLLDLLFNSMLIHGANNASRCPLQAWLVYHGVKFTLASVAGVGLMVAGAMSSGLWLLIAAGVLLLLVDALLWFWWAVVHSHHRELTAGFVYQREILLEEAVPPYRETAPGWPPVPAGPVPARQTNSLHHNI